MIISDPNRDVPISRRRSCIEKSTPTRKPHGMETVTRKLHCRTRAYTASTISTMRETIMSCINCTCTIARDRVKEQSPHASTGPFLLTSCHFCFNDHHGLDPCPPVRTVDTRVCHDTSVIVINHHRHAQAIQYFHLRALVLHQINSIR